MDQSGKQKIKSNTCNPVWLMVDMENDHFVEPSQNWGYCDNSKSFPAA